MSLTTIRKYLLTAATATLIGTSATAMAFTKPPFPRVGGINIGAPMNFNDPTYQAQLARQSVMILGNYPGIAPGGQSINTAVQAIKAKNPNAVIFLYAMLDAVTVANVQDAYSAQRNQINSMKWWVYTNTSFTTPELQPDDTAFAEVNITSWAPKDSQGNLPVDWMTKYFVANYYTPNPAIDGLYLDNTSVIPPVSGDWMRNGTVLSNTNPTVAAAFRQGFVRYYSLLKNTLMPGKYEIGNITTWGQSGAAVPPEYVGMTNGGVDEAAIGKSWSIEAWAGWQVMFKQYVAQMAAVAEPKLMIFNQWGDPTDYQSMRYGLGTCLLNDGYYSFTNTAAGYYGVVWFDELNSNLGQGQTAPTAAWQKGVWRRDFDNGIALVNPKGNGAQTVTLETSYVKLQGTQDPVTNNGQTVTTVTLKDRDGIILMRKNPVVRPAAPQKLTASP